MKIITIDQKEALDIAISGGKGASLARLLQAGFNVPAAFVISADMLEEDILGARREIEVAYEQLSSEYVSVRSSATVEDGDRASWAGQFETFLYVNRKDLIEKILACKASAHSDRAQAYAQQLKSEAIKLAVVVQKMVRSTVAGVGFSIDPITQDKEEMVIEAVWGLGEALVGGSVTPDTYHVAKDGSINARHPGNQTQAIVLNPQGGTAIQPLSPERASQQKLTDQQISEVSAELVKIETHYGQSIDIEWVYEGKQLYILQARPITTLTQPPALSPETKGGAYGSGSWAG